MKILICDDEEKYIDILKVHIDEYMKTHYIQSTIETNTSARDIFNGSDIFDLAFLDIQMDEVDGLSLAKELKKRNEKIIIFFVTNYPEFQDDAMDLRVFRFFSKPFDVERLYSGLDKALEYLNECYVDIYINRGREHIRFFVDDIVYVKRENRCVIIVTKNGEIKTTQSFDCLCEKLANTYFYLVHKSFYVNLHYVEKYEYDEIIINGGQRIGVASRKQSDFHKYWFLYLRGKAE